MFQFDKIKLVIWDLDDTLWNGTLSEGEISLSNDNIELIKNLTDCGIVNSICSKNDLDPVEKELEKHGIKDLFVFSSVNWQPKGERIKNLISDMQLRPINVLFIDDNPSNLEEAKFCCPDIMTATPEEIALLMSCVESCEKNDTNHKRLKQYKVLEAKREDKANYSSNESFLFSSNITVTIGDDCVGNIDRIADLIKRANQLNFTKVRSTKEELLELSSDSEVSCGYVSVSDRFGDYGISGFYALKGNRLIHFCFSCRILGMGVEQYVYCNLGRPELVICGEVISDLSCESAPGWINQKECSAEKAGIETNGAASHSVLIKGPCDLFQILPYIADKSLIDTELTYRSDRGATIESTGHTTHIVESLRLTQGQKQRVIDELIFTDMGMYNDAVYKNNYRLVVISILTDANLGVYRRKATGEKLAFLEGYHPITDKNNWDSYISGEYSCANVTFTREILEEFSEKYEFVGINTPDQIVENLRYIKDNLPKDCILAVMLGGELYYEKNTFPAYENRHIVHKNINDTIRKAVADGLDIRLIDVNKYLVDQSSFYDHFNHYIKPVYYRLAGEIVELVNSTLGTNVKETSKAKMIQIRIKEMLAPAYYKLRKFLKR